MKINYHYKNSAWFLSERAFRLFSSIVVGAWIARYLGPYDFGLLSSAQNYVALFSSLSSMGLETILVRELIKYKYKTNEIMLSSFILILSGTALMNAVIFISLMLVNYDSTLEALIMVISLSYFFHAFYVIDYYFQSKAKGNLVLFSTITSLIISSALKIILIIISAPVIMFGLVIFFDSIVASISYTYFFKKNFILYPKKVAQLKKYLAYIIKESWPYLISGFLICFYMKIDQVIILHLLGNYSVGQYSAAARISEAFNFIPLAILSALFPSIQSAVKFPRGLYDNKMKSIYFVFILSSIMISLVISLNADFIISNVFGDSYKDSISILSIRIWSCVFVFIGLVSSRSLLAENLQVYALINTFLGAAINFILNIILIPKIGLNGAAFATILSFAFASYFSLLIWKKTRHIFFQITFSLFSLPNIPALAYRK
ncbi:flippase [Candidatus Methylopumilus universalis]|uniref:flippase n=1 Tax=Candidatus Methylopumilus universalis TaxID=2588536 RepID=UPI00111E19AC|nr:flippase [Candidatus Methylopumilus universalis]QDC70756.1 flippase [Candidatus Methylopumilus universalis]